ncbi:MAG: class I SAM-dependent DNA methyltransferase, partial [Niameybacter sp.]
MATIGFEEKLWEAADKLRNNMDAGEYKHVILGLIFLKYVSDTFKEKYDQLLEEDPDFTEDRDEYLAEGVFWVPENARWNYIAGYSKQAEIGQVVDTALDAIEKENDSLRGVLGEIIDLFTNINVGGEEAREKDVLGRVYEYFLGKFAANEGKGGGEFYTPKCIVKLMVEMVEPYKGYVYDPACGSGG